MKKPYFTKKWAEMGPFNHKIETSGKGPRPSIRSLRSSFMRSFRMRGSNTNLLENITSFIKKNFSAAQSEMSFEEKYYGFSSYECMSAATYLIELL